MTKKTTKRTGKNPDLPDITPTKCPHCKFKSEHKPAMIQHITKKHKGVKLDRPLRQGKYQHIPRPDNFDIAGCGVEIYYDHLTFIPDLENGKLTVEYLDKERVCLKCRKRFNLDAYISKRRKK